MTLKHSVVLADGERIAQSTPIEMLLSQDFQLKINDVTYNVTAPHLGMRYPHDDDDDVGPCAH